MSWQRLGAVAAALALAGCVTKKLPAPTLGPERPEVLPPAAAAREGPAIPPQAREPLVNDGSWRASASSEEPQFQASMAIDGHLDTRWSSAWQDNQWWTVDLGRAETLWGITLAWERAHAASYRVLVSADGTNWEEVARQDQGRGGTEELRFEPRVARHVRLELEKRATEWGFSLFEVSFNDAQTVEKFPLTATASSGAGAYVAAHAVDGDMRTRWSSDFSDDQWWMAEFDAPHIVAGVRIRWETAFGEMYQVQLSEDGRTWQTMCDVTEGDGQTDVLFFRPTSARFLRIRGIERGTGWGYSIWELDIFADRQRPEVVATSAREGAPAEFALDGDPDTAWHSEGAGEQVLTVRLPVPMDLGGVHLLWGEDYARSYAVEVSLDAGSWVTLYETESGNGRKDYVHFPARRARFVRVRCREGARKEGFALAEMEFKSGEEQASPLREYKAAAREAPRGSFPRWLTREQEFWTVVGLPEDEAESLLSEGGTVEPYRGSFCITPLVLDGARLVGWADVRLDQYLHEDELPLPTVKWSAETWSMEVAAAPVGDVGKSLTAVRYRVTNAGPERFVGHLALAVRPVQLNPAWQNGGFSPIREAECLAGSPVAEVKINGRAAIFSLTPPAAMGAVPLDRGDAVDFFSRGAAPPEPRASEPEGRVSVGLLYPFDLAPGEWADVVIALPLHEGAAVSAPAGASPSAWFEALWGEQAQKWSAMLRGFSIEIPEPRLIRILRSNLGYILINQDGPWLKPGSRNYAHSWIRDGAITGVALLRMGLHEPVRRYLDAYAPLVNDAGYAPFIVFEGGTPVGFNPDPNAGEGQEFDSQGQFVYLVRQYLDFTGDRTRVEQFYPRVVRAMRWVQTLRQARKTEPYLSDPEKKIFYGLLPLSNSHEGYFPAMHSYWDDFWALRGLKDAAYLAEQLGHPEDVAWLREEEKDLRQCLLASIRAVMERHRIAYIPGCAEKGDFDPTSTAIAIMACDEAAHLPQAELRNTFDRYFDEFVRGTRPGHERTFTPYEVRTAHAFVLMGQRERALAMVRYFAEESVRPFGWNHLAEVVHARPRAPSYIGDMPHTWVGSGFVNAVRSFFAYEEGGVRLVLAAGVDPAWAKQGVTVNQLPTRFGRISYRLAEESGDVVLNVSGEAAPPAGFAWRLPIEWADRAVEINGHAAGVEEGEVTFDKLPAHVVLRGGATAAPD